MFEMLLIMSVIAIVVSVSIMVFGVVAYCKKKRATRPIIIKAALPVEGKLTYSEAVVPGNENA